MFIKNKKNKRVSLIKYWTNRYLFTILIGLVIIGIISALWIRHQTLENRLNMMSLLTENMAERIEGMYDFVQPPDYFHQKEMTTNIDIDPFAYIVNRDGFILASNRSNGPLFKQLSLDILENNDPIQQLMIMDQLFYVVKSPIEINDTVIGWVVMVESKNQLTYVDQEYTQLIIIIISLALLGWAAIYVLSKRLARPIKEVAESAKLVANGNYQIHLSNESKEKEVYELIESFKEMTKKLEKLETMRTELLAGVTHELKTPVTSISGLLQALKDGVVSGEEAKEFLNISLNETEKMKTMVEDLLAFNQFATNAVSVHKEVRNVNELIEEAVYAWQIGQHESGVHIKLEKLSTPLEVMTDSLRFQQIMTNLLNNAKQAMDNQGNIYITIKEKEKEIFIDVIDEGKGIPVEEQPFIFERFFRGEKKKHKLRGLGLGLPLSKMIIQALDGDLLLLNSSEDGTAFRIVLRKNINI